MNSEKSSSKLAVIFGGEEIQATLLDGSTLLVRVRAMPVRQLSRVLELCASESELLEFVCLVPATHGAGDDEFEGWARVLSGWADNLSDASHDLLYATAGRLNFSRAATWVDRQVVAQQTRAGLMKRQMEMIAPLAQEMVRSLVSSLPDAGLSERPATKS